MGALSPIPVRQSMNRCRLRLPITGVTSIQSHGSNTDLFDYSSPPVSQPLNDTCNQNRVGLTADALRSG